MGSYNQVERLRHVLSGYESQVSTCRFEVIVIDACSDDGTPNMVAFFKEKTTLKHVHFLSQAVTGKAQARNIGVHLAKGTLIIISDADMIPDTSFVQAHFDAHQAIGHPCCIEGLAYNIPNYDWPPNMRLVTPQVPAKYQNGDHLKWFYFLTGNVSFPKSLFTLEGGFSESFTGYGWEDLELGYRFSKRNIPFYYNTNPINYHYHVVEECQQVKRKYEMGVSAQIFLKKHPELKWFLGMNPLSVFLRKYCSKHRWVYRKISSFQASNYGFLRRFSRWFMGEYNYLSGALGFDL